MTKKARLTLLVGFLGAGKTTLLEHVLRTAAREDWGVLINDLGALNVDAGRVREGLQGSGFPDQQILELSNGCICCSSQSEWIQQLEDLKASTDANFLIVEATGVAEPQALRKALHNRLPSGRRGLDFLEEPTVLCLTEPSIWDRLTGQQGKGSSIKRRHLLLSDPRRPLEELMTLQIEGADHIIVNKAGTLSQEDRERICGFSRTLQPSAPVTFTEWGVVDPALLWKRPASEGCVFSSTPPHEEKNDSEHHGDGAGQHVGHSHHRSFGLSSLSIETRVPYNEGRFLKCLRRGFPGLLRAKGQFWTSRQIEQKGFLSLTTGTFRADYTGPWTADEEPGQALVFIGCDLDEEALRSELAACQERA